MNSQLRYTFAMIQAFIADYGESPSIKEIKQDCQLHSDSAVYNCLDTLEKQGLIEFDRETETIHILPSRIRQKLDPQLTNAIYTFICESIDQGVYPSQDEIIKATHIGGKTLQRHLAVLESMGKITRKPHMHRSIRLTGSR